MEDLRSGRKHVFDLVHSFYYVKVLSVSISLGLFDRLREQPRSVVTLATDTGSSLRGMEALVLSLESMSLVSASAGSYSLTSLGSFLFDRTKDSYMGDLVRFAEWQADSLPKLGDAIRSGAPCWEGFGHYIEGAQTSGDVDENQQRFNKALDTGARSTAKAILKMRDFTGRKRLVDVGGNLGGFSETLLAKYPEMSATVFDLPQVATQVNAGVVGTPLAGRLAAIGGDFTKDSLPTGADLITYIRIFNSRTDDLCVALLRNAYDALAPNGECLFYEEHVIDDAHANLDESMLWGIMFILISSNASVRTLGHWKALFEKAGFVDVGGETQKAYGIVYGRKPG